ncbi:MAG: protein kinase [Planctomycetaceae bacterium]|nr:protein kinase [Planctomycetaceae bacterium]
MTILPANHAQPNIESLERIFQLLTDAPASQRENLLAELCPDPEVLGMVRELLKADSADGLVLDKRLFPAPVEMSLGEQIGPYKLLQKIGEGGMGIVYMAEQSVPVRRKVALKIIKPGADSKQVLARFSAERQALSLMDHPNIAKVLDVGATESGRPYFVMELVKGRSITQYCQDQELGIRHRLELLMTVCHAVQHAHQKGILHRDLKPSNVLVTEYDGRPVAKVIDFGVAKAIENPLTEITLFTGFGQIVGTLEYMSPEQSRMNQLDVDVRSDVYSLGVLCYELITGSTPIPKSRLRTAAWDEMLRIIREEDPPLPSTRLSDWQRGNGDTAADTVQGKRSQAERQRLSIMVRGELDWIVMKALEKDRARRYASPGELAQDIDSHLKGDIVKACPPSLMYRFHKTFKRHKLAVLTTALVLVSLILGLAGTTWQAWRATEAERMANAERDLAKEQAKKAAEAEQAAQLEAKKAAEAERVAQLEAAKLRAFDEFLRKHFFGFLNDRQMFDPEVADPNITLSQLLDRARERLADDNDPSENRTSNQLYLKLWLSRSNWRIGRYEVATSLHEEYVDELRKTLGEQHEFTLQYVIQMAQMYGQQFRWWDACASYEEAFLGRRSSLGEQHPETRSSLSNVANAFRILGLYEQAAVRYRQLLEIAIQTNDGPLTAKCQAQLGHLLDRLGQPEEAEQLVRQAIESFRRQGDNASLYNALCEFGLARLRRGRHSEAQQTLAESCELGSRLTDGEKATTPFEQEEMELAHAVACLMVATSQSSGEPSLSIEEAVAALMKQAAKKLATAVDDLQMLASCLEQKGKLDQAEQLLRRAFGICSKFTFHGTRRSSILADLADIAEQQGDHLKAKERLLQAVECLADTEKYPSKFNQQPEFAAALDKFSSTLADRLAQVHRQLGDQAGADVGQEKAKDEDGPKLP